jgi:hypothetical protein
MMEIFEVVIPLAKRKKVEVEGKAAAPYAPRVDTLRGKKIGLVNNSKSMASPTLEVVKEKLSSRFTNITFTYFKTPTFVLTDRDYENVKNWALNEKIDAAIGAMGD